MAGVRGREGGRRCVQGCWLVMQKGDGTCPAVLAKRQKRIQTKKERKKVFVH